MTSREGKHENSKTGKWTEWGATATTLESIMLKPHECKCDYGKFYGNIPEYRKYLRSFRETGASRSINILESKLKYQV